jgi:hypothetical protein
VSAGALDGAPGWREPRRVVQADSTPETFDRAGCPTGRRLLVYLATGTLLTPLAVLLGISGAMLVFPLAGFAFASPWLLVQASILAAIGTIGALPAIALLKDADRLRATTRAGGICGFVIVAALCCIILAQRGIFANSLLMAWVGAALCFGGAFAGAMTARSHAALATRWLKRWGAAR